jgi:RNA polymerase-binding protein DksA
MTAPQLQPRADLNLKRFRELLRAERQRLESELHDMIGLDAAQTESEELGETADYDQHPADVATDTFMRERDEAMERSLRAELAQVVTALEKIEAGTYGYCDRCHAPIPVERLRALPYALLCVTCASLAEV